MKIVKISWTDSNRYMYQMELDEEVTTTTIETVGWLVSEDEDQVVLAQDIIEDDIRGVIVIPKVCIVETRELISQSVKE